MYIVNNFLIPFYPQILSSFIVLLLYYSFYYSSIGIKQKLRLTASAFFYGIAAVGLAFLFQSTLRTIGISETSSNKVFIYSALMEELSKFIFIYFFLNHNKINNLISEGIYFGIILGGAFGILENIFYAYDFSFWSLMLRTITSIPIHLLNSGILAYYCMKHSFSNPLNLRWLHLIKGFIITLSIHSCYNWFAINRSISLILIPVVLIYAFIFLEVLIARSFSFLPKFVLDLVNLHLDDYELIHRYSKHEQWLHLEQVTQNYSLVSLFKKMEFRNKVNTALMLFVSLLFLTIFLYDPISINKILKEIDNYEFISIFIFYPLFIAINFWFGGLINPDFFQKRVLKIPLLIIVYLNSAGHSEESITFFMNNAGLYTPLKNPEKFIHSVNLNIIIGFKEFENISAKVTWMNIETDDENKDGLTGALLIFDKPYYNITLYYYYKLFIHRIKSLIKSFRINRIPLP